MEDRDDYPIIPQPEGSESKMEQVAYEIAMKIVNVPDNKPEHTADHKLHSIHSIVINTMRMVEREKEKELASLKEENAKLKFRADLMAIYKQEKEDRDKILHQIKCTLYDRLTETEKLNDILKFFPTALKPVSDNK